MKRNVRNGNGMKWRNMAIPSAKLVIFQKVMTESRHNLTYWNNEEYYGFGAGAHGYVNGERIQNVGPLKQYFNKIDETGFPYLDVHVVTEKEKMEEELFLGLRKNKKVYLK